MALWGKQDAAAPSNGTTVSVTNGSTAVSGSGTTFLSDIKNGDTLIINSGTVTKARVLSVTSNTALVLADNFAGTTNASLAIANFKIQQAPKFVYQDSNHVGIGQLQGKDALPLVYGIDKTEIKAGGDNVVSAAIGSAGARYIATDNSSTLPTVTFSGGGGSSAAAAVTISSNAIATITLSNGGSSYTSAPTIAITKPRRTIATASINTTSDTMTYTGHLLVAGDVVQYNNGGSTSATGLTSTTNYYVATAGLTANAFEVKAANTTGTIAATVATSGTGGQFTCGNSTLAAGDRVTITGTLGGTGTITSYATGTTYKVSAVTGTSPSVTGFTLTTEAGGALTTTAGTLTGLTYTTETVIDITATGNAAQYFELQGATDAATATATLGSGTHAIMANPGWVRRTVGTGGLAGRVRYEVLVAGRSLISGDDANSLVEIETPNT